MKFIFVQAGNHNDKVCNISVVFMQDHEASQNKNQDHIVRFQDPRFETKNRQVQDQDQAHRMDGISIAIINYFCCSVILKKIHLSRGTSQE